MVPSSRESGNDGYRHDRDAPATYLRSADPDVDLLLPVIEEALTTSLGMSAMTGSCIFVDRSLADPVRRRLSDLLGAGGPGPSRHGNAKGLLITTSEARRIDALVHDAIIDGAEVLVLGGPAGEPTVDGKVFYHPTLLEVADPDLPILQCRTSGLIMTIQIIQREHQELARAGATHHVATVNTRR